MTKSYFKALPERKPRSKEPREPVCYKPEPLSEEQISLWRKRIDSLNFTEMDYLLMHAKAGHPVTRFGSPLWVYFATRYIELKKKAEENELSKREAVPILKDGSKANPKG